MDIRILAQKTMFNLLEDPAPLIEEINRQADREQIDYDKVEEWKMLPLGEPNDKYFIGGMILKTECWEKIVIVGRPPMLPNASKSDEAHYSSVLISWKPFIGPTVDNKATFASMTVHFCDIKNVNYDDIRIIAEAIKGLRAVGEIRLEAI